MAAAKKKTPSAQRAPDMTGVVQPTIRIYTQWTPDLIRSAELQADGGYLRYAANVCDWLLTDDRVSAALRTRTNALLGLDPDFERAGDKRRSNRAIRALEAEEDWWSSYSEAELSEMLMWGLLLGVKPARHTWVLDEDTGRRLPCPEGWHPQHLRYDWTTRTWKIYVATLDNATGTHEVEITPGDGEWILHTPYGPNRPWAMGLWRALSYLVLLKHLARQDWSRAGEKGAMLVLTTSIEAADKLQGNSKELRQKLASDIYNRGRDAIAALPPGIDLKVVETALKTTDIYDAQINMVNEAIAVLIRGGNLGTVVTEGGSRAAAEVQERTGDQSNLRFDAQTLTSTIHDQSLVWWAQFNFGDPKLAPWPVYPVESEADLKDKTETDGKALANLDIAERLGLEVDRKLFLEEHKINWADPGERDDESAPVPNTWTLPSKPAEPGANPFGAQPAPPPAGATGPNGEPAKGKPGEKPTDPNAPQAKPVDPPQPKRDIADIELRSGASAKKNSGFIAGQLYADDVGDAAAKHASGHMAKMVAEVADIIDRATSYEGLRKDIRSYYRKRAKPHELADLVEKAMTLAQLGGSAAVLEDVPELEK